MDALIRDLHSRNINILPVVLVSLFSILPFALITQLQRTRGFIDLLILPLVGYLLIFVLLKNQQFQLEGNNWKLFWIYSFGIRLIILLFPLGLSDDIYRYIWDGHVQHAGYNPYMFSPDAPQLMFIREDWWHLVNNPHISTPYPPVSQILFWIVTLADTDVFFSVLMFRVVMTAFDLGCVYLLIQLLDHFSISRRHSILYSWSPLVLMEFSGNGHNDAMALFFMLLSLYLAFKRPYGKYSTILSAIVLGLGVLTKFFPILVLPFLWHKWRIREYLFFTITIIIFSLPYYKPEIIPLLPTGQQSFIQYFRFNESLFRLYDSLFQQLGFGPELISRIFFLGIFSVIFLVVWVKYLLQEEKDLSAIRSIHLLLLIGLLLGPDAQPWYILWFLPLSVVLLDLTGLLWSVLVLLSYQVYPLYDATGVWKESPVILIIEYVPVYLLFVLEHVLNRELLPERDI